MTLPRLKLLPGQSIFDQVVFAAVKVVINLLIDISYAFLDPRIRY